MIVSSNWLCSLTEKKSFSNDLFVIWIDTYGHEGLSTGRNNFVSRKIFRLSISVQQQWNAFLNFQWKAVPVELRNVFSNDQSLKSVSFNGLWLRVKSITSWVTSSKNIAVMKSVKMAPNTTTMKNANSADPRWLSGLNQNGIGK